VTFGGAGPLSANAIGRLLGAWPVIVPPSPGVLCAHGDAVTKLSHEMSTSYLKVLSDVTSDGFRRETESLRNGCLKVIRESLGLGPQVPLKVTYEVDLRYKGQVDIIICFLVLLLLLIRFAGDQFDHLLGRAGR
jgi:5-oxoprolinase (ATP-hydrolysing)